MALIADIGDTVRIQVTFRDAADAVADPTTVQFISRTPAGVETVVTAPDVSIINPSIGVYYSDVAITEANEWTFRWNGIDVNGVPRASFEDIVQGRSSRMTTPLPP